jgi:hypothetical protein
MRAINKRKNFSSLILNELLAKIYQHTSRLLTMDAIVGLLVGETFSTHAVFLSFGSEVSTHYRQKFE